MIREKIINKVCTKCNEKSIDDNGRKYCKICRSKVYKEAGYNSSIKRMIRNRDYVQNYKRDKRCQMCGYEKYPEILDFHHKKGGLKSMGINKLMKSLKNLETIQKEIEKCILVCPNYHRELHLMERFEANEK